MSRPPWFPASSVSGWLAHLFLCPAGPPIPLMPSYWPFSFLLLSGALGRQGETATHAYIFKQKQHIIT